MVHCVKIMNMLRGLHTTVLTSLEGIAVQMEWLRDNWYEEVRLFALLPYRWIYPKFCWRCCVSCVKVWQSVTRSLSKTEKPSTKLKSRRICWILSRNSCPLLGSAWKTYPARWRQMHLIRWHQKAWPGKWRLNVESFNKSVNIGGRKLPIKIQFSRKWSRNSRRTLTFPSPIQCVCTR